MSQALEEESEDKLEQQILVVFGELGKRDEERRIANWLGYGLAGARVIV